MNIDELLKEGPSLTLDPFENKQEDLILQQEAAPAAVFEEEKYLTEEEKKQVEALGFPAARIALTLENAQEAESVLNDFIRVYVYDKEAKEKNYTKGHFKRGAE